MRRGLLRRLQRSSVVKVRYSFLVADKSMKVGGGGRYQKLVKSLADKGVRDPRALAASIGRKKYGAERFQEMAAAGRRRAS